MGHVGGVSGTCGGVSGTCRGVSGTCRGCFCIYMLTVDIVLYLYILCSHTCTQNEAEELYRKSGRYDLLIQFYQAMGKWNKVCTVCMYNVSV